MLWGVLAVLAFVFGSVMFSETMSMTAGGWFGTQMNKLETLKFVAFGMGGILAALGAVAINRRASAQVRNNELIEKGHIEERFKSATEGLGNDSSGARIAAFYQFYYLAKDNPNADFRKNIFEILCAHLRNITRRKSYQTGDGEMHPTEECQILLNVLFKPEDKTAFAGFRANLQYTYLVGANLQHARMENADFSFANLRRVDLRNAKLERARLDCVDDLTNALLVGVEIDLTNPTSCPPQYKWGFYADGELTKFSKDDAPRKPISKHEGGWGDPPNFGDES